jgi:hypothetical protein
MKLQAEFSGRELALFPFLCREGLKFFMPDPLESSRNYKKLSVLFEKILLKAK